MNFISGGVNNVKQYEMLYCQIYHYAISSLHTLLRMQVWSKKCGIYLYNIIFGSIISCLLLLYWLYPTRRICSASGKNLLHLSIWLFSPFQPNRMRRMRWGITLILSTMHLNYYKIQWNPALRQLCLSFQRSGRSTAPKLPPDTWKGVHYTLFFMVLQQVTEDRKTTVWEEHKTRSERLNK